MTPPITAGKSLQLPGDRSLHLLLTLPAVDGLVPVLVRVNYLRLDREYNFNIRDLILLDPYDTSLSSLHSRLRHLLLTSQSFIMEHDYPPLTWKEKELNESGIDCRLMGTNSDILDIKVHHENVRPVVMALAANMQHMFLSICFGPCR